MDTILIIILALAALTFAWLWWRNRGSVASSRRSVERAETQWDRASSKLGEQRAEIASLKETNALLEKQATADQRMISQLRESGRKAAEKIADLEPLADQARRSQAQRVAASKAALAKRQSQQAPPVDTSAMPRRARRVGRAQVN